MNEHLRLEKNMSNANKKEALFLIESQPPHLGELVSVLLKIKEYDVMHICVSAIPQVVPINRVMATWLFLLDAYKDKVTVSAMLSKFEEMPELPEMFKGCTVLTTCTKVYVHLSSLNLKAELVPKTLGYCGAFQRTAYRQGRALDYLLSHAIRVSKHIVEEE